MPDIAKRQPEALEPLQVRRLILEAAYSHRADNLGISVEGLAKRIPSEGDMSLHQEISYLQQKNWLHVLGEYLGKQYLNYSSVKITAWGIELVEDKAVFDAFFAVTPPTQPAASNQPSPVPVGDQLSHLSAGYDAQTQELIKRLLLAADQKDKDKVLVILGMIGDRSTTLLMTIVSVWATH